MRRCCCPARKMEGEFSRARPLVKSSHSPLLPLRSLAAALVFVLLPPAYARKGGKGRRRVVKCGEKLRREGTTTTTNHTGRGSCEWGRSRSILLHSSSLGFRAVVSWCSRTSRIPAFLTLISVIVRTYIYSLKYE